MARQRKRNGVKTAVDEFIEKQVGRALDGAKAELTNIETGITQLKARFGQKMQELVDALEQIRDKVDGIKGTITQQHANSVVYDISAIVQRTLDPTNPNDVREVDL